MVPSFDPAVATVAQAADFVAVQAEVGFARSGLAKQAMARPLTGALLGGGLGAGLGMLSSTGDDEADRDRNWWRNVLMGGALGAGVGGMAGVGMDLAGSAGGLDPKATAMIEELRQQASQSPAVNDPVGSAIGKVYSWLNPGTATIPPDKQQYLESQGVNTQELASQLAPSGVSAAGEYAGRVPTVAASGLAGAGLGHLYDRARAPGRIGSLTPDQLKTLSVTGKDDAESFLKSLTPKTEIRAPLVGAPTIRRTDPPRWLKTAPPAVAKMTPHLMRDMQTKFAPRSGKLTGGIGAAALAPLFARMFDTQAAPGQ